MEQASNWLVNQLQADLHPTIATYNFTANDSILDCCCISAPQQVHLTFDSRQYNLGPDGREVIGIIVHVPPCRAIAYTFFIRNVNNKKFPARFQMPPFHRATACPIKKISGPVAWVILS
jgi:hypothetical protein